ncbi:elongator complex protein 3 [Desulfitibacter alkalitolerans]|uniref:elongator complex protein 3 n=1 Tax=Desulfitibacter alkalitolerans TaxID=264641 RepID=UPI00047F3ED7|nr:radical SAM protein [Desulfitibacter alkalitolerans]
MKHYIIPIFVPHMGCPFQCVFCDQRKISGTRHADPVEIINSYLETINKKKFKKKVEVAFYGGSFTAIEKKRQIELLSLVQPYIMSGRVDNIRISTRPDFISIEVLDYLKKYGVSVIELGVQSLDDKVLELSGRGHDSSCVYEGAKLIKEAEISLGIQLMPGLPGDTLDTILATTKKTIYIKPDFVRIYPTVVIQNTFLHELLKRKKYFPLKLSDAVNICAKMYREFINNRIQVIRMGLQATDLLEQEYVVQGPYHPSFGEMVLNEVAYDLMANQLSIVDCSCGHVQFIVPYRQLSIYLGQKSINLKRLRGMVPIDVNIVGSRDLPKNQFQISTENRLIKCFQKYIR